MPGATVGSGLAGHGVVITGSASSLLVIASIVIIVISIYPDPALHLALASRSFLVLCTFLRTAVLQKNPGLWLLVIPLSSLGVPSRSSKAQSGRSRCSRLYIYLPDIRHLSFRPPYPSRICLSTLPNLKQQTSPAKKLPSPTHPQTIDFVTHVVDPLQTPHHAGAGRRRHPDVVHPDG
jgi:hypothetical protein